MEPHVKVTTDFEIYESVVMKPTKTILPYDPSLTPNYTLSYKVRSNANQQFSFS